MRSESIMDLLDHLNKTYPYSVARWVKDNAELHITLKDINSPTTKTEDYDVAN